MQKKGKVSNEQRTAMACESTAISKIDFGKSVNDLFIEYFYPKKKKSFRALSK